MIGRRRPGTGRNPQRLTPGAREIFGGGGEHAFRLGHRYFASEHVLLALVSADHPVAAALRAHGLTPERVEDQVVRLGGGGIFGGLDEESLTAIGIDLDSVRERAMASFGPEALSRASRASAAHRAAWLSRWDPRPRHVAGVHRGGVFLPSTPDVGHWLHAAHLAEVARHDTQIDVLHVALGLLAVTDGAVPPILAAIGTSAPELRDAIGETGEPRGA